MIRPSHFAPFMAFLFCVSLRLIVPAYAQVDAKAAARVHFDKGVAAFEARRYREAAEAFDTAYKLSPAFVVLYNIGQVNVALGNAVEAVDAFEEYLELGASSIPAQRRHEVQTEIEDQLTRIGTLTIRSSEEGAEIRINGDLIGTTPLAEATRLNAGRYTVQVLPAGHPPQLREVDVAGKAQLTLEFTFEKEAQPEVSLPVPPPEPTAAEPKATPVAASNGQGSVPDATPVAPPGESDVSPTNWLRLTGYGIALGGVALGTVGGLQVWGGVNEAQDAKQRMAEATTPAAYDAALPDYEASKAATERGWAIAGVGAGVLVGGIILAAAAPDPQSSARLWSPWVTANSSGMTMNGVW